MSVGYNFSTGEKFVRRTGIREKDGGRSFGNLSIVIAARETLPLSLSLSLLRSLNDEK